MIELYEHEHKYFMFQVKQIFEALRDGDLYESVEYGFLSCNCGSVIKRKVKTKE